LVFCSLHLSSRSPAAHGVTSSTRLYDLWMAYDEALAQRIRDLAAGAPKLTEKKMFGGLAFLVGGNMAVAASGQGGILVRVDPEESSALVARTAAEVMVMRGRPMEGWLHVAAEDVRTKQSLAAWVKRGTGYAASLPAK
jgi:TfoX/Sxy family transcriptional regulator of competence genes